MFRCPLRYFLSPAHWKSFDQWFFNLLNTLGLIICLLRLLLTLLLRWFASFNIRDTWIFMIIIFLSYSWRLRTHCYDFYWLYVIITKNFNRNWVLLVLYPFWIAVFTSLTWIRSQVSFMWILWLQNRKDILPVIFSLSTSLGQNMNWGI